MYRIISDSLRRALAPKIRALAPKIVPRFQVSSRIHPNGSSNLSSNISGLGLFASLGKTKRIAYNPFLCCANRFDKVRHFIGTVPYTKRKQIVLLPNNYMEKLSGKTLFEHVKFYIEPAMLPAIHPQSIRVRLIFKEIIDALQRDLNHEEDQIQNRKKDSHATNTHLKGINWDVFVEKNSALWAYYTSEGQIVVCTGLLTYLNSDAEVASVIAHEVAHVVARHKPEKLTNKLWSGILLLGFYQFVMPSLVMAMIVVSVFFKHPRRKKMELEAGYIGMLLLASAGYDPRIAPIVYDKLGNRLRSSELLSQANVMEKALMRYRESSKYRETKQLCDIMAEIETAFEEQRPDKKSDL